MRRFWKTSGSCWSGKKGLQAMPITNKRSAYSRDYSVSTYIKFSEKLTFLTPWYAHVRVGIGG